MKRNRWMILILVVVIGFLYFKVSDSERTISAACFTNEIQTVKKEKKYYLEINPTKERVRCTKEEYDRVKNGDGKQLYSLMYKKNPFLTRYFHYEPQLLWLEEKN
ncbi:hypothetical protein [Anaerostipes sp.]|uniref:hypothetical protein n=1 Tax=Anaerostipes sp. TaxID=1872530 RepID=UPI0025B8B508|nr:hypothetical protein [Anaerostipes sp.]MBS7006957.1 hypothetical protein [Anaerostipes sp.]